MNTNESNFTFVGENKIFYEASGFIKKCYFSVKKEKISKSFIVSTIQLCCVTMFFSQHFLLES